MLPIGNSPLTILVPVAQLTPCGRRLTAVYVDGERDRVQAGYIDIRRCMRTSACRLGGTQNVSHPTRSERGRSRRRRRLLLHTFCHLARQTPPRLCQLRDRESAAEARAD